MSTTEKKLGPVVRGTSDVVWDDEADAVIVGGGIAGLSAAVHAADHGASVVLLERAAAPGGTTAKSSGGLLVPKNRHMRAQGIEDPKDDFLRLLARIGRPLLYDRAHTTLGLPQWEYHLMELYWETAAPASSAWRSWGRSSSSRCRSS